MRASWSRTCTAASRAASSKPRTSIRPSAYESGSDGEARDFAVGERAFSSSFGVVEATLVAVVAVPTQPVAVVIDRGGVDLGDVPLDGERRLRARQREHECERQSGGSIHFVLQSPPPFRRITR